MSVGRTTAACAAASNQTSSLLSERGRLHTRKALSALVRSVPPWSVSSKAPRAQCRYGPGESRGSRCRRRQDGCRGDQERGRQGGGPGVKRSMRPPLFLPAPSWLIQSSHSPSPRLTGASGLDALPARRGLRGSGPSAGAVDRPRRFQLDVGALDGLASIRGGPSRKARFGALISGMALANAGMGAANRFSAAVGGCSRYPPRSGLCRFLPRVLAVECGNQYGARLLSSGGQERCTNSTRLAGRPAWPGSVTR